MRTTGRTFALAAGSLLTVLALPATTFAQQRLDPVQVTSSVTARADALHARARTLDGSVHRFNKMASLHEQSAALRGPDDPMAFTCLQTAALLRYYAGDRRGGGDVMERAAEGAAVRGDVINAATAYIDAAIIQEELRQPARMLELGRKAQMLTSSPLITETQRIALRSRLGTRFDVAMLERP